MSRIDRFEDLIAWQKARALAGAIHRVISQRPFARDTRLSDQLWRAAISVPSNIAEGFERNGRREFHQFLSVAKASCAEVRSHLYIAHDVGYIGRETLSALLTQAEEISRIVGGLRRSINRELLKPQRSLNTQPSVLSPR